VCVYIHKCIHTYTYIHRQPQNRRLVYASVCIHTYIHIHIHTQATSKQKAGLCKCVYTYIHMHIHTQATSKQKAGLSRWVNSLIRFWHASRASLSPHPKISTDKWLYVGVQTIALNRSETETRHICALAWSFILNQNTETHV
jgi:hypothetical protein